MSLNLLFDNNLNIYSGSVEGRQTNTDASNHYWTNINLKADHEYLFAANHTNTSSYSQYLCRLYDGSTIVAYGSGDAGYGGGVGSFTYKSDTDKAYRIRIGGYGNWTINVTSIDIPNFDDGDAVFNFSDTSPHIGQDLYITQSTADPDGNGNGTLSYSWQTSSDNSTWNEVGTSATYTVGTSEEGKSIFAVISYQDAQGFDESVTTATSSIPAVNHGEAVFGLVDTSDLTGIYSTDSVKVGDTIKKGDVGSDPDHGHRWQTESYSWQTTSDNSTWNEVGTSSTYTILAADDNKSIRCAVSYTDNQGFNEVVNTHSVKVINDSGDASFSIVGTKSVGNYLSIKTDSQDPDGTGTLSYQWQSSSDGSTWSNVSTNSTYRLQYIDSDKYYKATISYTDDDGFSETITTDTIQIDKHSIHTSLDSLKSQLSNLSYSTSYDYTSLGYSEEFGSSSGETLYASANEIVWGLGGNDSLRNSYSTSDQYLIGGSGNDTYTISGTAVAIIYEAPNQGTNDTLYLSSNYSYYGYAASIDNKHLVAIYDNQAVFVLDGWENTGIENIYLGNVGYTSSYFLSLLPSLPGYLGNVSWDEIKPYAGDILVEAAKRVVDEIKSSTITVESDFENLQSSLKNQIAALEAQADDLNFINRLINNSDVTAQYDPTSLTTAALAYIASHPDLLRYFGSDTAGAIKHYNDFGYGEGREITFNATQYLANNSDLTDFFSAKNGFTTTESITKGALKHFIDYGHGEGRTDADTSSTLRLLINNDVNNKNIYEPLSDIEALNYLATNNDLAEFFDVDIEGAKAHYEDFGYSEGRTVDDFDEWGYLASNHDLINVFGSDTTEAIEHYISYGISEGRLTDGFNAEAYLNNNADLSKTLGINQDTAKKHYVEYGFNEGRIF